jgi:hypothetical protein
MNMKIFRRFPSGWDRIARGSHIGVCAANDAEAAHENAFFWLGEKLRISTHQPEINDIIASTL